MARTLLRACTVFLALLLVAALPDVLPEALAASAMLAVAMPTANPNAPNQSREILNLSILNEPLPPPWCAESI